MRTLTTDSLVLCSGTVRDASLVATVRAAAAAGFEGVSLYHNEYVEAQEAGWSVDTISALLDDEGVAVAELDGVMRWLPDDQWGPSLDEFVDVAAALGARSITALEVDGRRVGVDRPLDEVAEAFAGMCDRAADAGLLVHLEYFPFSGIPDLATATAVARAAGRDNGGVLCDFWHHVRGPDAGTPDFAAAPVIAVQVGDVAARPSSDLRHEMVHGRVLPGAGAADVVGLLRALRAAGCTAPMEVEVYSDELAALDPLDAARAVHAALTDVLVQAGLR